MIDSRVKRLSLFLDSVGQALDRLGVSPAAISLLGLVVTLGGAALVASGKLLLGAALVGVGSGFDALDGAIARATDKPSPRGAQFDSILDRIGETAMWAGLAYFVAGKPVLVVLCVLCLGFSVAISYLRAKAEINGVLGTAGWMTRTQRVVLYVVGVGSGFVAAMLWLMATLTAFTVAQRFRSVWKQLPP